MSRYDHAGRLYDLVSMEPLYRSARRRLLDLLDLQPGMSVVDVGCGTGRNLPALRQLVGPTSTVFGVDASASMLAAARRRVDRSAAGDVRLLRGGAGELDDLVDPSSIDAVIATFVLSLLPDDARFWHTLDRWSAQRPVRIGLAELGRPREVPMLFRPVLGALTAFGGGDPDRRSWDRLLSRCPDGVHEQHLGGHVHLAVGTMG